MFVKPYNVFFSFIDKRSCVRGGPVTSHPIIHCFLFCGTSKKDASIKVADMESVQLLTIPEISSLNRDTANVGYKNDIFSYTTLEE